MRYFFILFFFIPYVSYSQVNKLEYIAPCDTLITPLIIKTSVLAPLHKFHMLTLGIEVPVYKYTTIELEGGYIYKYREIAYELMDTKPNIDLRIDMKHYFSQTTTLRLYTGPMMTYQQADLRKGEVVIENYTDMYNLERTKIYAQMNEPDIEKRRLWNALWKTGVQPIIADHYSVDVFTAFGLGFNRNTTTTFEGVETSAKSTVFQSLVGLHAGYAF